MARVSKGPGTCTLAGEPWQPGYRLCALSHEAVQPFYMGAAGAPKSASTTPFSPHWGAPEAPSPVRRLLHSSV